MYYVYKLLAVLNEDRVGLKVRLEMSGYSHRWACQPLLTHEYKMWFGHLVKAAWNDQKFDESVQIKATWTYLDNKHWWSTRVFVSILVARISLIDEMATGNIQEKNLIECILTAWRSKYSFSHGQYGMSLVLSLQSWPLCNVFSDILHLVRT